MAFWIAVALSALAAIAHIFVGTGEVRGPLMAAGIDPLAEQQLLMVWHMISVVLVLIAVMFLGAALRGKRDMARAAVMLSLGLGVVSLVVGLMGPLGAFGLPQWTLLFAMAFAGGWGLRA